MEKRSSDAPETSIQRRSVLKAGAAMSAALALGAVATPAAAATVVPGGVWVNPGNNFTVQGNTVRLTARAYPSRNGDPAISYVNFTATWQGAGWQVINRATKLAGTQDTYQFDWNILNAGVPNGGVTVSFDVYDVRGNKNNAPNGTRQGTARLSTYRASCPFKSQWDPRPIGQGGQQGHANCGPASVAMAMGHFGKDISVEQAAKRIRANNDAYSGGNTDFQWDTVRSLLQDNGLQRINLSNFNDVKKHLDMGHPVLVLVHNYRYVRNSHPCPDGDGWTKVYVKGKFDHYTDHIVVATGYDATNVYVNDPLSVMRGGNAYVADTQNGTNFAIPVGTFQLAAGDESWKCSAVALR